MTTLASCPPSRPSPPPPSEEIKKLMKTQIKPLVLELKACETVKSLQSLELLIEEKVSRNEWRSNVFLDIHDPQKMSMFRCASSLASHISNVTCRGVKRVSGNDSSLIKKVGAEVICKSWELIDDRVTSLIEAIHLENPELVGRLKIGGDITIRRTTSEEHGTAAPYETHLPSAPHTDSHDGTILGFGLISTKLGTPTYPTAYQPSPVFMFLSQSRTGKNKAHQVNVDTLGKLREWNSDTLVVMPACTAHSKPSMKQINNDLTPNVPRWFCRVTIRILIPDLWKRGGKTK